MGATEQTRDRFARGPGRVVVDVRRAGPIDVHERGEHRGDRVAIPTESARRTDVDAVGEGLCHAHAARAVLRQCGGARRHAPDATRVTPCELSDGAGLAIDRRDEEAWRERRDRAAPRPRPRGDAGVLDGELIAVRTYE